MVRVSLILSTMLDRIAVTEHSLLAVFLTKISSYLNPEQVNFGHLYPDFQDLGRV